MGITNIEYLEDRIRVSYHLEKPWGYVDEDRTREIEFASLDKLPRYKDYTHPGSGYTVDSDIISLPDNKALVFVFARYPEKSAGPLEEVLYDIYLVDK